MLTDLEKYLFDLHGFLHLKTVAPAADLRRMSELCTQWHALPDSELPPPLRTYSDSNTKPTTARAINNVEYGDEAFQRLALNREIMRPVLALTHNCPQLLDVALTQNTRESDDIRFHGGVSDYPQVPVGLHHPACDYQAFGDTIFASFLNAAVSLVDVPEGAGFVCIPGSHKANFRRPVDIDIYHEPPLVANICPRAGDVVLFTEALVHGARRWTADYPRQTVFVRYSLSYASWSPGHGPIEAHRDKISDEIYQLHQQCGFQARKSVVSRLLGELGS